MHIKILFISDAHLRSKGAMSRDLYLLLKNNTFGKIYILGDFIDFWRLKASKYWPQEHTDCIQQLLKHARKGTEIIVIPGNHDEILYDFLGEYGNIKIVKNYVHITSSGEKILLIHGHELDVVTMNAKWLTHLGDFGYNILLWLNRHFNHIRRFFKLEYWSLSKYLKHKVKEAVNIMSKFEEYAIIYAKQHNATSIMLGHIHHACVSKIKDINYYNCGDLVESGTFLIENDEGKIEIVNIKEVINKH